MASESLKACTVLVVEDYDAIREVIQLLLIERGLRVCEARDGAEAIEMAQRELPDLILMDLGLPLLDGVTAIRRIRETEVLKRVHIIAISAYDSLEQRNTARDAGCDRFIAKRVDFESLADDVSRVLSEL